MMQKTEKIIYRILTALFLLLFLPVLFSIILLIRSFLIMRTADWQHCFPMWYCSQWDWYACS